MKKRITFEEYDAMTSDEQKEFMKKYNDKYDRLFLVQNFLEIHPELGLSEDDGYEYLYGKPKKYFDDYDFIVPPMKEIPSSDSGEVVLYPVEYEGYVPDWYDPPVQMKD